MSEGTLVSFDTAVWTSKDGKLTVNVSYRNPAELIQKIYALNCLEPHLSVKTDVEMFEAVNSVNSNDCLRQEPCVKCGSENIVLRMRVDKDENKYFEKSCTDCYAKLAFGAHKKGGGLFGKRFIEQDGQNVRKPDNGWMRYDKALGKEV